MSTTQHVNDLEISSDKRQKTPSILNLFSCKCPRCRIGNMFATKNPWDLKNTMKMNRVCPVCAQPLDVEVGFYFGSGYVSYALSVALCAATFVAWWVLVGFSFNDNRFLYWIIFNAVFLIAMQPYLMRVARTGWLAFFVTYDPDWNIHPPVTPERTNKDQENNW